MSVNASMKMLADAVRNKAGTRKKLSIDGMINAISKIDAYKHIDVPIGDVNFFDFDGTCLYSFTKEDAISLDRLPPLVTHEGLVCQGWNWSLEDIHRYVKKYGICDIGAMYTTEDGKTRLYIDIASIGRMTIPFCFTQSSPRSVTVDWVTVVHRRLSPTQEQSSLLTNTSR